MSYPRLVLNGFGWCVTFFCGYVAFRNIEERARNIEERARNIEERARNIEERVERNKVYSNIKERRARNAEQSAERNKVYSKNMDLIHPVF